MAETLSEMSPLRITLSATPNNATQVNLPAYAEAVLVHFIANDGKVHWSGTDAAAIGTNYLTIPADNVVQLDMASRSVIFLASATASAVVECVAIPRGGVK